MSILYLNNISIKSIIHLIKQTKYIEKLLYKNNNFIIILNCILIY
jgi:hypothetical protein